MSNSIWLPLSHGFPLLIICFPLTLLDHLLRIFFNEMEITMFSKVVITIFSNFTSTFFFHFCFIYLLCWRGTLWHLQSVNALYHSHLLPFPIPGTVATAIIFPFVYICTQYLYYIHPPTPFPHILPLPTGTNYPRQDLFCPTVLWFCKRKKLTFLFKIAT
jgi:hypothetical protein